MILEELGDGEYLIVTTKAKCARAAQENGVDVIVADPSNESTLRRARIDEARAVLVATNNDAEDALSVLTARQLNPEITIVAAATNRENVAKLRRAGANAVISPASIVGHLLVTTALGGEADADIDIDALTRDLSGGKDGNGA